MRTIRFKADNQIEQAYYHCISRVVDRRFGLGPDEKERFVRIMRGYEDFCGVRIVTFCIMSSHFHLLLEVPKRPLPEEEPSDCELVRRLHAIDCDQVAKEVEAELARYRQGGHHEAADALRQRFFRRMWDVSWYIRLLKQRFTQWLNSRDRRTGTFWEGRFRSVLVEGKDYTLTTMAAYIDLNPMRAGIVDDPKDYRWSGYGDAVAGIKRAREGLAVALSAYLINEKVTLKDAMERYRSYLYVSGQPRTAGPNNGEKARRGFSPEEIDEVLAKGGKLELQEAIRCRVRYFCDGAVLGSRAFVERIFQKHRGNFGPKRKTASRPMREIHAPGLYVARALRVRPLG